MASYGSTEKFHFGGLWLTTSEENQHFLQFHFFRREVLKKKLRKPLIDLGNGYFFINWGGKEWWFNLRADSVKVTKERRGPPRKKQLNFPLEQAKPHSPIGFPHSHKTEIDYSTTTITISGWGRGGGGRAAHAADRCHRLEPVCNRTGWWLAKGSWHSGHRRQTRRHGRQMKCAQGSE